MTNQGLSKKINSEGSKSEKDWTEYYEITKNDPPKYRHIFNVIAKKK